MGRKKIHFLQSHAIQYHSPLYDRFAQRENVDFKVWYCSDYGLEKSGKRYHPEFGELPNWDINLVNGHPHELLKNYARKKGIFKGFWGLVNWDIFKKLKAERPDVLVIMGWNYFTLVWAVICCKWLKIPVYVRGDNTLEYDTNKTKIKKIIKKIILGKFLFPIYTKIGFVGTKNKEFFLSFYVKPQNLIHLPHAIDNNRFINFYESNFSCRSKLKNKLKLSTEFNIAFFGRLNESKRVIDLLDCLSLLKGDIELILVGDGIERNNIEIYTNKYGIKNYRITGFKNQLEILEYYLTCDVVVLPSNYKETWGLVINEAMCFHLPVIVSDKVGCSSDLVTKDNGFIFPVGNVTKLAEYIQYLYDHPNERLIMGENSGRLIRQFSYQTIIQNILNSFDDSLYSHF